MKYTRNRQKTYILYIYIRHTFELYDRTQTKHTKHGTQTWHTYSRTKYTHTHTSVLFHLMLVDVELLDCESDTSDTIASRRVKMLGVRYSNRLCHISLHTAQHTRNVTKCRRHDRNAARVQSDVQKYRESASLL